MPSTRVCVIGGAAVVGFAPNLVSLNVGVQVMNALLLPLVLGFLIRLAMVTLPPCLPACAAGILWVVLVVCTITCALGVYGGLERRVLKLGRARSSSSSSWLTETNF